MFKKIKSTFNPDMFQGWGKNRRYFEGWYYKIVNSSSDRIYAVIPGISITKEGVKHSFIQVLDGINNNSEYFTFDIEEFRPDSKKFKIEIAGNYFSTSRLIMDLPDFKADLCFSGICKWPNRWYAPGIMGPYTFAPFMECNHGVLSLRHNIDGIVGHKGSRIDFSGGRGYTEKDWGHSFPEAYIWLQSNHFDEYGISVKLSVARIPWLGNSFTGFIGGLLYRGHLYQFTTYNKSYLEKLDITLRNVNIVIANRKNRLIINVEREKATQLSSPVAGNMSGHILESMLSVVHLRIESSSSGNIIYSGRGINTALEVAGDIRWLTNSC